MNLDDVLRGEVLREYKSNKSDAMLTTMETGREDRYGDTLVDGVPGPGDAKLASVKKSWARQRKGRRVVKCLSWVRLLARSTVMIY